jgi:uncharacterized protein YoaH (UPF0181 family)
LWRKPYPWYIKDHKNMADGGVSGHGLSIVLQKTRQYQTAEAKTRRQAQGDSKTVCKTINPKQTACIP